MSIFLSKSDFTISFQYPSKLLSNFQIYISVLLTCALVLSFFEHLSFMICHVKTLDTWANRTWKWSEIMILTNIGWILKYKYLFNHPILSSLLRLHLCRVNLECDCVMCATCFTTWCLGLYLASFHGYPVHISVSAPSSSRTKPTWHSTFLLLTPQTCPKSVWDLPCPLWPWQCLGKLQ